MERGPGCCDKVVKQKLACAFGRQAESKMGKWPLSSLVHIFLTGYEQNWVWEMLVTEKWGRRAGELGKHSLCLFAFRKWNLLTAVVSSFQNECVLLIILVLCDSPRAVVWPKTGLWFGRPPHSPLRLQINHWNPGTFRDQCFSTALFSSQWPQQLRSILPFHSCCFTTDGYADWGHMTSAWLCGMHVFVEKNST